MNSDPKLNLTRAPLPAVTWFSFFKAVDEAMKLHLVTAGPPGQKAPRLVREYPKTADGHSFDHQFDVILFRVVSSVRSGTDRSGVRRVPKGPTLRESIPHPDKERYHVVTIGWWETMLVEFIVLAKSNDRVDEITEWFHKFMMRFIFDLRFFSSRGVNYMVFDSRGEDKLNKVFNQELYERTLRYEARLELLTSFEAKDLESLHITVQGNPIHELDRIEEFEV